ncbi:MAG: polysaccharide biosynthesis/export family protein [Rhodospirillaceae bacterium]
MLLRKLFGCLAVALLGTWLTVGPALAQGQEPAASNVVAEYQLGSGDHIKIKVFGHDDLSADVYLDGTGSISLPLIGTVKAGGTTIRQLEAMVADKLKPDYLRNPRVTVEVLNYRPFYIIGEVKNPGSYAYVNGMTIINAVALAGGYTYRARENSVFITRANDSARAKQRANHDSLVLPGDVIEVPERFF